MPVATDLQDVPSDNTDMYNGGRRPNGAGSYGRTWRNPGCNLELIFPSEYGSGTTNYEAVNNVGYAKNVNFGENYGEDSST